MKRAKKEKIFIESATKHICVKCDKEILANEKSRLVRTYDDIITNKVVYEHWYHLSCHIQYFNECVISKLQESQLQAMDAMKKNPIINNLMKNVGLLNV